MRKAERDKIVHLMKCGALHGIDTDRLDGKCEDVIPLEDAITIIDSIYKEEVFRCQLLAEDEGKK